MTRNSKQRILSFCAFLLTSIFACTLVAQTPTPFDTVITNGHIIDGTGSPWYSGDIGIRDGKIAAIGNLSAARANAPSTPPAKSSRPASSTCSASPK